MDDNCRNIIYQQSLKISNIPHNRQFQTTLIPDKCDVPSFEKLQFIQDNVNRFVGEGRNAYIFGENIKNGKTSWAINIMLQYFNNTLDYGVYDRRGIYIHVPTFEQELKNNISNPNPKFNLLKDRIKVADLVVWDDMTSQNLSNYTCETLYALIKERQLYELSNIYTGRAIPNNLSRIMTIDLAECVLQKGVIGIYLCGEGKTDNDFFTSFE